MGGLSWFVRADRAGHRHGLPVLVPDRRDGRILELLGHYHSHGKRFTAYLTHGDAGTPTRCSRCSTTWTRHVRLRQRHEEPDVLGRGAGRRHRARSRVKTATRSTWECHIVNDSDVGLTYTNEVKTGEMCNLWGMAAALP